MGGAKNKKEIMEYSKEEIPSFRGTRERGRKKAKRTEF